MKSEHPAPIGIGTTFGYAPATMIRTIRDYLQLRQFTSDAMTLVRVRKHHRAGQTVRARLKGGAVERAVDLRGGTQDVSVFFEIFARDAYHMATLPTRLGTVIDLGGNVGLFTLRASAVSDRVITFEPMPDNFQRLRQNTAGLKNVEIHNQAVGGMNGTLTLYSAAAARGTGRFSAQPQGEIHDRSNHVDVQCVTLDTVFDRDRIASCDLLKIDIEGSEYDVLLNASKETLAKIQRIHGEFHPSNDRPDGLAQLKQRLDAADFTTQWEPQKNDPRYGMFFARRNGSTSER